MAEIKEMVPEKQNLQVLPGNERKTKYRISPLPKDRGRFAFTWEVLTKRFGNMVCVNLSMLLFFIPFIVLMALRLGRLATNGANGAFGDNIGVGYPAAPDVAGMAELITMNVNTVFFAWAILTSVAAAVGIAGGAYCVKKLLRSDDDFHFFKDFFTGVKQGYFYALVACALSFAMLFAFVRVWDFAAYRIAMGDNVALFVFYRVLAGVGLALVILLSLWLFSIGTNYKLSVGGLLKNTLSIGFGTVLQSVFFAALGVLPAVFLFFSFNSGILGFLGAIASFYFLLCGFSAWILTWCSFNDWAFDAYADYTAVQTSSQEAEVRKATAEEKEDADVMSLLLVDGKNVYLSRAIMPLDEGSEVKRLPDNFTATDLAALAESKRKVLAETEEFSAAHAEEEKYKEYNARFADREKALNVIDKKGKKKKFKPQMLGN